MPRVIARPDRFPVVVDEGGDAPTDWVAASRRSSSAASNDATSGPGEDFLLPVTPEPRRRHSTQQPPAIPTQKSQHGADTDTPPPSPPSPSFAPVGRPMVRKRFRNKIPNPLQIDTPRSTSLSSSLNNRYSRAVASTLSRVDNAQFIEKFRYTIITSHLLGLPTLGQHPQSRRPISDSNTNGNLDASLTALRDDYEAQVPTALGLAVAVTSAFVLAWAVRWVYTGGIVQLTKKRFVFAVVLLAAAAVVGNVYVRQQRLRHLEQSALTEIKTFVALSHNFDSAATAAIAFIKEVELVSRGYRISAPLPPISRMDDRSQSRRCMRLRKAIRGFFANALPKYIQATNVVQGLAEQLDLEMYYHVHDISDFDISDALQGFSEAEFDDADSIRTLTVLAARFHTVRKLFLCALLALEANGDDSDFLRWTTAVEGLRTLNETTDTCYKRLQTILGDVETFPVVPTPKAPLSPGRERWRSQLGKLNSLSTGIRGLQAKLALLREESDWTLNEADDITQLGPNLMAQYDSIGQDLKLLMQAWEEGRSALASGIDRNEKRLSSLSALLSPALSLSGLTTVDEDSTSGGGGGHGGGTAEDALRALTGGSPLGGSTVGGDPEEETVFEAVSLPPASRRTSLLTREERMSKMKEERERRAEARERADANRGMLRELEMVINLRPKPGQTDTPVKPETERNSV
ncbi:proliferating cell nuclear antigen [Niveomyces insectorum RCEF 264]|uniref:Vezatin n=1 Tax=Niveomyces insectorum RCEF 264 TaxID=1081102 RepID=A0A168A0S3_9HYPO|nr:proliferating cell nuclear antigen [Niveomyces insectorum RCEF 264]